jgi:hypothetical protein
MRHFDSRSSLCFALLAAFVSSLTACSDSDHRPPIGAPTGPIVVSEGGSSTPNGGQGAAGTPGYTAIAGNLNAGGTGGDLFGAAGGNSTGFAGGPTPPFGSSGSPSAFGGSPSAFGGSPSAFGGSPAAFGGSTF